MKRGERESWGEKASLGKGKKRFWRVDIVFRNKPKKESSEKRTEKLKKRGFRGGRGERLY